MSAKRKRCLGCTTAWGPHNPECPRSIENMQRQAALSYEPPIRNSAAAGASTSPKSGEISDNAAQQK